MATLDDLAPMARAARWRNAEPTRMNQWMLREYVRVLVEAYGYREDFKGSNPPWVVPYLPLPFAGEMLDYFEKQAQYWLGRSIPEGAKQPNFMRNRIGEAREIVGKVRGGVVVAPNGDSYEEAPARVAAKAPAMFRPERPAGQAHTKVLKADATWRFFRALQALAIHCDALSGQPTKLDIFAGEFMKQAETVGGYLVEGVEKVVELPGKVAGTGKDLLKWGAIAAVGLGVLYVVTR